MRDNEFGDITNDRFLLNVKVAEHLFTALEAYQLGCVAINIITKERHGTCGTEVSNVEILGFKAQVWSAELDGGLEGIGDHCGCYVFSPSYWHCDPGQGGGRGYIVGSQEKETPKQGGFGTQD